MIKSFLLSFNSFVLILLGLVGQYFFSRYLSQEDFGMFFLILSWLQILSFFSLNSFNAIVMKAASQGYRAFYKKANLICLIGSLIGSVGYLIIGKTAYSDSLHFFILIAAVFPFYGGLNLTLGYLNGVSKYYTHILLKLFSAIILILSQIYSVVYVGTVYHLVLTTLTVQSGINLVLTVFTYLSIKQTQNKQEDMWLIKYAIKITGINIIPTITSKIQYVILGIVGSPVLISTYGVAQILPDKIKNVFRSLFIPYTIFLSGTSKHEAIRVIRKSILLLFITGVFVSLTAILLTPFIISLIYGESYSGSILYAQILFGLLVFLPIELVANKTFLNHEDKKSYFLLQTLPGVFQILFFVLFIPSFKIQGIILALYFISIFKFIFILISINKSYNKNVAREKYKEIIISDFDAKLNDTSILNFIQADKVKNVGNLNFFFKLLAFLSFTKITK